MTNCKHFDTTIPYISATKKYIDKCECAPDCSCWEETFGVCWAAAKTKSGMSVSAGGGKRANKGKLPLELISPYATRGLAKILAHGLVKYAPRNWENGLSWTETIGSLKRHILELELGHNIDDGPEGSGLPHVDGIQVNAMFLAHFFHTSTGTDDRALPALNGNLDVVQRHEVTEDTSLRSMNREQKSYAFAYQRKMLESRASSDARSSGVVEEEARAYHGPVNHG